MDTFLYLSISFIALFFFGTFIGIPGINKRIRAGTGIWNISFVYSAGWFLALILYGTGRQSGALLHLILAGFWLAFQLRFHWIPYLIGAPDNYRKEYKKFYEGTLSVLPGITSRGVVPNFYHTLILILLVATIIAAINLLIR